MMKFNIMIPEKYSSKINLNQITIQIWKFTKKLFTVLTKKKLAKNILSTERNMMIQMLFLCIQVDIFNKYVKQIEDLKMM